MDGLFSCINLKRISKFKWHKTLSIDIHLQMFVYTWWIPNRISEFFMCVCVCSEVWSSLRVWLRDIKLWIYSKVFRHQTGSIMVAVPFVLDNTNGSFSRPLPSWKAISCTGSNQFVSMVAAVVGNRAMPGSSVEHVAIVWMVQVATVLAYMYG